MIYTCSEDNVILVSGIIAANIWKRFTAYKIFIFFLKCCSIEHLENYQRNISSEAMNRKLDFYIFKI